MSPRYILMYDTTKPNNTHFGICIAKYDKKNQFGFCSKYSKSAKLIIEPSPISSDEEVIMYDNETSEFFTGDTAMIYAFQIVNTEFYYLLSTLYLFPKQFKSMFEYNYNPYPPYYYTKKFIDY